MSYRNVVEFAPDANPRCVDDETIATASLPFEFGLSLLGSVYGFAPDLKGREGARVEFSLHPARRGWLHDHTVIWQIEQRPSTPLDNHADLPNQFSRMIGDKAFGLSLASAAGLPVPRSVVTTRNSLSSSASRLGRTDTGLALVQQRRHRAFTRRCEDGSIRMSR